MAVIPGQVEAVLPPNKRPWRTTGGVTAYTKAEIAARARNLLESQDYQAQLELRIKQGTLPPALETMLWHYAYGKPPETLQVVGEQEDLSQLPLEELMLRIDGLRRKIDDIKAVEEALPLEIL